MDRKGGLVEMAKAQLEFFFEFSSPFGYVASELVEDFAARLDVDLVWKPFLMGAVFKVAGTKPLLEVPLKGDYSIRDLTRTARLHGIPYKHPPNFPLMPVSACRAAQWALENAPDKRADLIHAILRHAFAGGGDFGKAETVAGIAETVGIDGAMLLAGIKDAGLKERLRDDIQATVDRGVFGSPYFIYDGEPFWGVDHMNQLERWITTGGW